MKKSGIYKITNIINNKFYIGSSKDILHRFSEHKKHERNIHLIRSFKKYGIDNFKFEILEYVEDFANDKFIFRKCLLIREQCHINKLKPEYNECKIAGSPLGYKHSQETKEKMKLAKEKTTYIRLPMGEEQKEKLRIYHLGKKHSQETIEKIREKNLGENNAFYGKKHTKESREKMSLSHKDKHCGKDNAFYGKKHTEETKNKISIKMSGENNHNSKLLDVQRIEIYEKYKTGLYSQNVLAQEYDVTKTTINTIIRRLTGSGLSV